LVAHIYYKSSCKIIKKNGSKLFLLKAFLFGHF
jgi:hypothetical protein